ncbi:tachylectin-related carbohydrate-binding protein [Streptomyces sp. 3214.6]|uniref:tachylectin-related carbohydrate-binding protein n=1 Tax=Streptomyces sp. 3214.6 TaxID=1882757 RepID=UPI00090B455F|nr:tachylectin-related carbohydrate-binding protein [Streptomyces sp. 3214.6]SHI51623.1 Tachylectin [Streptomyces sp. 3214.6]
MTLFTRGRAARLTAMAAAAAAALPLLIAAPGTAHAADAATCRTNGPTYGVNSAGSLLEYKLKSPINGAGGYLSPTTIGSSWNNYPLVISGPDGKFYLLKSDGTWYGRRDVSTGAWAVSPRKITTAFGWLADAADRNQVTVDRSGRMWVLLDNGSLYSYRYDGSGGAWTPADTSFLHDTGWNRYDLITAADDGVIYGRAAADGKLYRSRFDSTSQRWIERHVLVSSSDWHQFKSITSNGGDTLMGVQSSTGQLFYYRFDENTRSWPVNRVEIGTSGWQNLLSVSGAPDNCGIAASHTPASPAIPLESYSRGSVMQSSTGSVEFAYTDNIGRLVHGRMADPSDVNGVQWTTISGNEAFTGQPSLVEQADGRISVTAHNTSGSVWQRNQVAKSSADWAAWNDQAGAMRQHATTAKLPSGQLVQFAADANGAPWYRLQTAANGEFLGWLPLSGTGFSGPFTAVTVRDGLQLFGKNASGVLSTALFKADGTLSAWTSLGAQAISGTPSAVVYPGYRIRVFATDGNGNVVTVSQSVEGGAYGEWTQVVGLTAQGSPSAVISPLTGLTEIVVRGTDGYIHNTGETTQGSGVWRTWQQSSFETSATEPTAVTYTNANGPTWAYSFRTADNQTRFYAVQQTAALSTTKAVRETPDFTGRSLPTAD